MNSFIYIKRIFFFLFFFQAEDGIRDTSVTGVQTCALPILAQIFSLKDQFWGSNCLGIVSGDSLSHFHIPKSALKLSLLFKYA